MQPFVPNDFVGIAEGSESLGAGTDICYTYYELFRGEMCRVILDRDVVHRTTKVLMRKIIALWPSPAPHMESMGPVCYQKVDMSIEKNEMDTMIYACMTSKISSPGWEKRRIESDEARERYRRKIYHTHTVINQYNHDRMFSDFKSLYTHQPYLPEHIYTDASVRIRRPRSIIQLLRDWYILESAASVVITTNPMDPQHPVFGLQLYSEDDNLGGSSSLLEKLALVQAMQLVSNNDMSKIFYTDSLGCVKQIGSRHHDTKTPKWINDALRTSLGDRQVKWVQSHAERRKEQTQWTVHEWGNVLADMTAGYNVHKQTYTENYAPQHRIKHFMHGLEDFLRSLIPIGTWYWSNADGTPSFLSGPTAAVKENRIKKYLETRQANQTSTDKYEWTSVNLKYTSVVWKFSSSSYAEVGMY